MVSRGSGFPNEWDIWDYVTVSKLPLINTCLKANLSKKGVSLDLTMGEFELLVANNTSPIDIVGEILTWNTSMV